MTYMADAFPAVLLAVRDALQIKPCQKCFRCGRSPGCPSSVRNFIRYCWNLVPISEQPAVAERLRMYRFACVTNVYPGSNWHTFKKRYVDEKFGPTFADDYDDWCGIHKGLCPATMLFGLLHYRVRPSLEVMEYILQPVSKQVQSTICARLFIELMHACRRIQFVTNGRRQFLEVQFTAESEVELRPLD